MAAAVAQDLNDEADRDPRQRERYLARGRLAMRTLRVADMLLELQKVPRSARALESRASAGTAAARAAASRRYPLTVRRVIGRRKLYDKGEIGAHSRHRICVRRANGGSGGRKRRTILSSVVASQMKAPMPNMAASFRSSPRGKHLRAIVPVVREALCHRLPRACPDLSAIAAHGRSRAVGSLLVGLTMPSRLSFACRRSR